MKDIKIRNKLSELSSILLFDLDDHEIDIIMDNFYEINDSLDLIKKLNVDFSKIEPLSFIEPIRMDNCINDDNYVEFNSEEVFANCEFYDKVVEIKNEK